MKKGTMVPFVKWVGGKRQLQQKLKKRMPSEFNNYYEPFVGGGAFLYFLAEAGLLKNKAIINDLNSELINAYEMVKEQYTVLREYLMLMELGHNCSSGGKDEEHSPKFYNSIRKIDRNPPGEDKNLNMDDSDLLKAARFIYLNKAGFNGLYRVNSTGEFNVPSGKKSSVKTHEYPNLALVSKFLKQKVKIMSGTFDKCAKKALKNDFVYFDPPYDYEKGTKGFDAYQKGGFGKEGQEELFKMCKKLDKKGVKWMVSNHNTKYIQELYKDFHIDMVKARRLVGGQGASRKEVDEVVITNKKDGEVW